MVHVQRLSHLKQDKERKRKKCVYFMFDSERSAQFFSELFPWDFFVCARISNRGIIHAFNGFYFNSLFQMIFFSRNKSRASFFFIIIL